VDLPQPFRPNIVILHAGERGIEKQASFNNCFDAIDRFNPSIEIASLFQRADVTDDVIVNAVIVVLDTY
jgi:hypothetical protein